jgi:hypothetical protein
MQRLEVSSAVRHIYIYVIRQLKVKNLWYWFKFLQRKRLNVQTFRTNVLPTVSGRVNWLKWVLKRMTSLSPSGHSYARHELFDCDTETL